MCPTKIHTLKPKPPVPQNITAFTYSNFYLFLERGEGREKKRERNINVRNINWLPSIHAPAGNLTHNPGICPAQELNWQPFAFQNDAQPTEPHQSGQDITIFRGRVFKEVGKVSSYEWTLI